MFKIEVSAGLVPPEAQGQNLSHVISQLLVAAISP